MDQKTILIIGGIVVIALAIIFKDRIKATFMGIDIDSGNNASNKNQSDIKGDSNKVNQGTRSATNDTITTTNKSKVDGKGNEIDQG